MMAVENSYTFLRHATKTELSNFTHHSTLLSKHEDPDHVLPDKALHKIDSVANQEEVVIAWRKLLVTEAVSNNQHLVVLGDPGGGKSTFIRHLAMTLAHYNPSEGLLSAQIAGWDEEEQALPIIVSLRELAGTLAKDGISHKTVYVALRQAMESYSVSNVDDLLSESLHRGVALLLFDGLDEVPSEGIAGEVADRLSTLRAIRDFAQQHSQVRMVVTCRTRAFEGQLRKCVKWPVETLASWTLGQIRYFVPAWYMELATTSGMEVLQAKRAAHDLLAAIIERPKLAEMARTPLLLTMMALVLYNDGTLPRDRPQLYERILAMLLGRWDSLRGGDNLATAIGHPNWDSARIRVVLDELSYIAHRDATSSDGRGRISRAMLRDKLIEFFKNAGLPRYADAAERCLEYFQQRSGLLLPDDEHDSFMFAHLTLQEHCAGCYLVSQRSAVDDVMSHRNDDRFREPIFLGLGMLQEDKQGWLLIEKIIQRLLIHEEGSGRIKAVDQWIQDLILAAEIGVDRNWIRLKEVGVDTKHLLHTLRHMLAEIIEHAHTQLGYEKKIWIGDILSRIGDPRPGICTIRPLLIHIKHDDFTYINDIYMSKYLITNWQYNKFITSTNYSSNNILDPNFNKANQPVIGISWTDAIKYCKWLTSISHYYKWISDDLHFRLPLQTEWLLAASGVERKKYPWGDEYKKGNANTDDLNLERTTAVGCFIEGASPYGILDMCGNVWEWTCSAHSSYVDLLDIKYLDYFINRDVDIVLCGGSWNEHHMNSQCNSNLVSPISRKSNYIGFRIVLSHKIVSGSTNSKLEIGRPGIYI
jgi:energy-coupling factor transporter ATP-binding protein EcfA2